jgi:hypothetical protein
VCGWFGMGLEGVGAGRRVELVEVIEMEINM